MTTAVADRATLFGRQGQRAFRPFFVGQSLSALGSAMSSIAVAFAVLDIGQSASALGAVLAARYLPLAGFLLLGGVVADRMSRRRLIVHSDVVRAAAQGCLAVLLLSGQARVWHLVALQGAFGVAEAFFTPARTGLVPHLVPAPLLPRANALIGMSANVARVAGPALGGLLVSLVGSGSVVAIDAATFGVSALLLARLRFPETVAPPSREGLVTELLGGWHELRARAWLSASILNFTAFSALALPALWVLGPELARIELGGVRGWALLTGAFGIGSVVGSLATLRVRPVRPAVACAVLLAVAALRPAIFVSGLGLPVLAGYSFVAGVAMSMAGVLWMSLLQNQVPRGSLSRVSSIDYFGSVALTPVGYLLAGPLAAVAGLHVGMVVLAVTAVAASLGTLAVPGIRRLRWTTGERPVSTVDLAHRRPGQVRGVAS
ncbi:MAG: transporter [Mycobacterium sp.]|nr:transporter [Mycobacterium sp.]